MRISIRHELRFTREEDIAHAVQHLLLTPRDTAQQTVLTWDIAMPGFERSARFDDAFGNIAHMISQTRPEEDLAITVTGSVETKDNDGVVGTLDSDPIPALFKRITPTTRPNGNLVKRIRAHQKAGMTRVEQLDWLMNFLHEGRDAQSGEEEDAPEIVAEDHAHVFVAAARGADIPARFVTGYLLADGEHDARLHYWAEAYDDTLGWIGFDPFANVRPTQSHVRLAAGLDAETAVPVRMVPVFERSADDVVDVREMVANQQQQQQ